MLGNPLRDNDLFGNKFAFPVILTKERRQDLFLRKAFGGKSKTLASQELSSPDKERMDNKCMIMAMEPDHILIHKIARHNLLFLDHMLDIFNLISNPGRLFKVELFGFLLHLLLQTFDQVFVLSLKEHPHLMDNFPILVPVDLSATWAGTTVHLIIDAGSETARKLCIKAGTNWKEVSDQSQGLPEGSSRWIRAEVE